MSKKNRSIARAWKTYLLGKIPLDGLAKWLHIEIGSIDFKSEMRMNVETGQLFLPYIDVALWR